MLQARKEDAVRFAQEQLRAGSSSPELSPEFRTLVAELMEGRKLKRILYRHWIEIGEDYDDLRTEGDAREAVLASLAERWRWDLAKLKTVRATREAALATLTERYGWGETTIRKAVAAYHSGLSANKRAACQRPE
jgi:hypothetical protein